MTDRNRFEITGPGGRVYQCEASWRVTDDTAYWDCAVRFEGKVRAMPGGKVGIGTGVRDVDARVAAFVRAEVAHIVAGWGR